MHPFITSILITILALILAGVWAGWHSVFICVLLIALDVSFSFDNSVVNATVLRNMNALWQRRFLTWGMLIAVFGIYYFSPILIVSIATGLHLSDVMAMAVRAPDEYGQHLMASHTQIAAFGGMFLLMVFFQFVFDERKTVHWLAKIERRLAWLGKLEAVEILIALAFLLALQSVLPEEERLAALVSGAVGIALHVAIGSIMSVCGMDAADAAAHKHSGLMGFIYLNILDASFSLDAVVGSFAISGDIVTIVLGLSAGAFFVRSLTVHLVRAGTLERYIYLEHGAHYAIGALAVIMLVSLFTSVPEVVTGLIGIVFLLLSLLSSVKYNKMIG